ncbi:hypothetical protein, partial [Klebsiella pneumoniae]|uniref:hypothetical protein n=1 Tax=Klebsiella pneumoniae TaxID=573 RepID=UPI0019534389
ASACALPGSEFCNRKGTDNPSDSSLIADIFLAIASGENRGITSMTWSNRRNSELLERARRVIPGGMYGHEST